MDPKSDDVNWSCALLEVSVAETLEDFGDVTQVESVVRLRWNWFEWASEDALIDFK
jgi:hypothetical protein